GRGALRAAKCRGSHPPSASRRLSAPPSCTSRSALRSSRAPEPPRVRAPDAPRRCRAVHVAPRRRALRQEGLWKGGPARHVGGGLPRVHAVPLPAHAADRLVGGTLWATKRFRKRCEP